MVADLPEVLSADAESTPMPESNTDASTVFRQKIASRCSGNLARAIRDLPPALYELSEADLEQKAIEERDSHDVKFDLGTLRMAFWREYSEAVSQNRVVNAANVCSGTMSFYAFSNLCKHRPVAVAYMIQPQKDIMLRHMRLEEKAEARMNEVLSCTPVEKAVRQRVDELGDVSDEEYEVINVSLASLQFKIWKELLTRIAGNVPTEQRMLLLKGQMPANYSKVPMGGKQYDAVEIKNRLIELKRELAEIDDKKRKLPSDKEIEDAVLMGSGTEDTVRRPDGDGEAG